MMKRFDTMDGNEAAAHASYFFTDVATIYPITPSSPMAEHVDEWAAHGRTNLFGQPVKVVQLQSEAGAAGAMHGSLAAGGLTTTYTASQGLLLMIPNLYKMVGELLPGVLHVSARAIATHALSIFGDHQDVMACRQTGAILLASSNAQQVMDLATIAHLCAIQARLPVVHFFDGFRTSHEYQKVEPVTLEQAGQLLNLSEVNAFRQRSLTPEHPTIRGTAQNPDIYFQGREVQNRFFDAVPDRFDQCLARFAEVTGRAYQPFSYYGDPKAKEMVISMGSLADIAEETVDQLTREGAKVGCLNVHLYRPFSALRFLNAIPESVERIAVLDRTKEPGALAEPLYLDVVKAFAESGRSPLIIGGRYGLGSKDTDPAQLLAVFANLREDQPKDHFTIGIEDDVTHTSLTPIPFRPLSGRDEMQCKFYGLGSDGTVGANKKAIEIIGNHTDLFVQAYFAYDSKKSGGTTVSHLRFGSSPIKSHYLVKDADYIACHNKSFLYHLDLLDGIKDKGTFVLNCDWKKGELEDRLPAHMKRILAEKQIRFYTIDATSLAGKLGLGNRINMIMQAAFFQLLPILPIEESTRLLKESIEETYGKKGQSVVHANQKAVDVGMRELAKIHVPKAWKDLESKTDWENHEELPPFITNIQRPMAKQKGDSLPVSAFLSMEDGSFPPGTTAYEKRGIAVMLPKWRIDKCIECGMCSYVCPHATIRLFLLNDAERERAPLSFETKEARANELQGYGFRVQVSPLDCTGCGNCADVCPVKDKALVMEPAEREAEEQSENWEFAMTLSEKPKAMPVNTLVGSQLQKPLLEFNGACPGCGETPYIRLLTQLFGERMMIANATGCSSIWGASAPSIAYTTTEKGRGPVWANSLFEDNAEYGYGMHLAVEQLRDRIQRLMEEALSTDLPQTMKQAFAEWIKERNNAEGSKRAADAILSLLDQHGVITQSIFDKILSYQDYLVKRSFWMIGGDGWAYDIGFGGVDQVLSAGDDVNLFVMDTELYSNTGGQSSKATPAAAVAKFAAKGKQTRKKDLGLMAMSYGDVYVAQIAMGANMNHTLKAILEAESYPGPSLIIAYSPCVSHGIKSGMGISILHEKLAVDTGYWHLYRYDPRRKLLGEEPFQMDSKTPKTSYTEFLNREVRYTQLATIFPEEAEALYQRAEGFAKERYNAYQQMQSNKSEPRK